jgi:hypothetical protein
MHALSIYLPFANSKYKIPTEVEKASARLACSVPGFASD